MTQVKVLAQVVLGSTQVSTQVVFSYDPSALPGPSTSVNPSTLHRR